MPYLLFYGRVGDKAMRLTPSKILHDLLQTSGWNPAIVTSGDQHIEHPLSESKEGSLQSSGAPRG